MKKSKRKHTNTDRVRAEERANAVRDWWVGKGCIEHSDLLRDKIKRALQAHARETLDRAKRKAAKRGK